MKTLTSALSAILATLAFAPCARAAEAPAAPATVPIEAFFSHATMSEPVMSPSGDALAILVRNKAGRRQLAIIDTSDLHKVNVAVSFEDADVASARWANDKRLVFATWHEEMSAEEQNNTGSGFYAVDRDGGNLRVLIDGQASMLQTASTFRSHALPYDYAFVQTLSDGTSDVIVEHVSHTNDRSPYGMRMHVELTDTTPLRLDTRTGLTHEIVEGKLPDHVFRWLFDDVGHVVAAQRQQDGTTTVLRPDGPGKWNELVHFSSFGTGDDAGAFEVRGVATDGVVYVDYVASPGGQAALYRLDLSTGRPETEPLVSLKGFDFEGGLIEDRRKHKVLGVHYVADAAGTIWFDPAMKALQARIDARLPGLVNEVDPASCGCATRVLVTSFSDRQPALFFLYDRTDDTLIPIGSSHPAISPRQMADTDFVRIKARDGQEIPVYVTKPHGKGPWPAVVLVHGGPQVRGWRWQWDNESQFLASRGYVVIKPEYRGSTGYGSRLFRSGFRQWGLAAQDDIADATIWAAAQGLADPGRVCIAGASYGGYATLMGLVRYGNLYRCGVAWAAVADIPMMYDTWWSDSSDEWKGYGMPVMIGDPVKDAAQLVTTSPLKQAAHITRPLLLAHGGVDRRVPIEQAFAMRDALVADHAPITWIYYKDEAHGWSKPSTNIDFYRNVEAFLNANIGAGLANAGTGAPSP